MSKLEQRIELAKAVLIQDIYQGELSPVGNELLRGKCPLHGDEGKPNFTVYLNTNTWFCFVCRKGRDSIDLYMALHNVDFKEAVKVLSKW